MKQIKIIARSRLSLASFLCLFFVSCFFAADSFALTTSTDSVHTHMDALELMSQRMGQATDKYNQDYLYTGNVNSRALSARPAVVTADRSVAPVPVAAYTAKASVYRAAAGSVPALTVSPAAVMAGAAADAGKSAASGTKAVAAPGKTDASAFQKAKAWVSDAFSTVKNGLSDAFSAVKTGLIEAKTWVHDKVMGKGRALTADEIAEMKAVFGGNVDYSKVRVVTDSANMGLWGRILTSGGAAVTWGKTIYFPNGADGKSQYSFSTKAYWLAHEMTHEYQYQKYGWGYVPQSVWGQLTKGDSFYDYQLEAGKGFRDYNVEQQGDLVAHYYQILNGTRSATPEELAIYQKVMADQGLF